MQKGDYVNQVGLLDDLLVLAEQTMNMRMVHSVQCKAPTVASPCTMAHRLKATLELCTAVWYFQHCLGGNRLAT